MGHLILAGAGHAHLLTLSRIGDILRRGHRVSVIGPSEYHYYSGMGPGMLGKTYTKESVRFNSKQIVERQGGTFIKDTLETIDWRQKVIFLSSGACLAYDVLSCNCGSAVQEHIPRGVSNVFSVKPIENLLLLQQEVLKKGRTGPVKIIVVGGGPSSAEVAGNIMQLAQLELLDSVEVTILCRSQFLRGFPESVTDKCKRLLYDSGVVVKEECGSARVIENGSIWCHSGQENADLVVLATGVMPAKLFEESGMTVGQDGGMAVNEFLQSVDAREVFGGGDCISFVPRPLNKVGVYAVRQNRLLYENLVAALERKNLKRFEPGGDYLLIFNMGRKQGVLRKKRLVLSGWLPFRIKDYIDRKFMHRFQ